jgi:1,4-alpha-glucan branching enzyme
MMSQNGISDVAPMGATLIGGGATFKAWAPRASAVYVNGCFGGAAWWRRDASAEWLMARDAAGYWTGFLPGAAEGDEYKFYVIGSGGAGFKRDPYARELSINLALPPYTCIIRNPMTYPWHDAAFVPPGFSNMVFYQLHVGAFSRPGPERSGRFLDVVAKMEHLAALGVNVLQLLPINQTRATPSMGYDVTDYFAPHTAYVVSAEELPSYVAHVNRLLITHAAAPLSTDDLAGGANQLKALVDLCHLFGIAVVFDVVYNHAGGFEDDDESLRFWDRQPEGDDNQSLFFTDRGFVGGLSFALWNRDVRQFLINNALYYLQEFHADGFRYDQVSKVVDLNGDSGWSFAQDITSTARFAKWTIVQNAEFWPLNPDVVKPRENGGAGFDVTQDDRLRDAVRAALKACSYGSRTRVDMGRIASALYPNIFPHTWNAVTCVEDHDSVKVGREPRTPAVADGANHRSWYARTRSCVATALLLTAPGIPMIFMGQEFLEDKQWSEGLGQANDLYWEGLHCDQGMRDHLRCTQALIALRRRYSALRSESGSILHLNSDARVLAFERLAPGEPSLVVVTSLNDQPLSEYEICFPHAGKWAEVFNSDLYDGRPNDLFISCNTSVIAYSRPGNDRPASARIALPANAVVVFVS